MQRSGVHFYIVAIVMLAAWQPCLADNALSNVGSKWDRTEKETDAAFTKYQRVQQKTWDETRQRVLKKWSDGKLPQEKIYVEYFDGDSARVKVDYENGQVMVEALLDPKDASSAVRAAKYKISKALSEVISSDLASTSAVLSADEISETTRSVKDLTAALSSDVESKGVEHGGDGQERSLYRVTFELVPDHVKRRAAKYKPTVEVWAKKYNLDAAFILAIMRQESAFNPRARSWVGAIGLMQIYPPYAGKEVFKIVKHRDTTPSDDFLYDPQNNIMMGATFLQILRDRYFADIKDKDKQRYLITCGYNWSAGRLRTAIANGRLSIRAPATEVFHSLEKIIPDETKGYLNRVTRFTREFRGD